MIMVDIINAISVNAVNRQCVMNFVSEDNPG